MLDHTLPAPDEMALRAMEHWMREREGIRRKRAANQPAPWTTEPLLRDYRWCNVVRADDRVSQWLLAWYADRLKHYDNTPPDDPLRLRATVLACAMGRLINWPDTLRLLRPDPYNADVVYQILKNLRDRGQKVMTGAYIINGALGGEKIAQITDLVLLPLWENPPRVDTTSMQRTHAALQGRPGIGPFMAGQFVADMRLILPGTWDDRMTWAPIGPGSIRGLRRLYGEEMTKSKAAQFMRRTFDALCERGNVPQDLLDRMELMDVQNCLCELDKFLRLRNREGTVRANYRSHGPLPPVS